MTADTGDSVSAAQTGATDSAVAGTAAASPTAFQQLEAAVKAFLAELATMGEAAAKAEALKLKPVAGNLARSFVAAHTPGGLIGKLEGHAANIAIDDIFGPAVS